MMSASTPNESMISKPNKERRRSRSNELPIDRGWAWVVVLASSGMFCIMAGTYKCYGIINLEILAAYPEATAERILWVFAVGGMNSLLSGPPMSMLIVKTSHRFVGVLGGLCAVCGLIASAYAPSADFMFLSLGVIYPIGVGAISLVCFTSFAAYFDRHKALAVGIMAAGSGIGSTICPHLLRFLFDKLSFSGALVGYSCFYIQVIVLACLIRPMSFYKRRKGHPQPVSSTTSGAQEAKVCQPECALNPDPIKLSKKQQFFQKYLSHSYISGPKEARPAEHIVGTRRHSSVPDLAMIRLATQRAHAHRCHVHGSMLASIAMPIGSALALSDCSVTAPSSVGQRKYNWKLWYNPKVTFLGVLMLFAVNGVNLVFNTAPSYASDYGVRKEDVATVMTAAGAAEILCRVFNGWLADRKFMPAVLQFGMFTGMAGAASLIAAFMPGLVGISILYGTMSLVGTSVFSIIPIITIELMSAENLAAVTGICSVYQAMSNLCGTFIANHLYASYLSWCPVYYFIGATYTASTMIAIIYQLSQCFENRQATFAET